MKYTFLFLFCSLLFVACGKDGSTAGNDDQPKSTYSFVASTDQDTARYQPLYLHDIPADVNAQVTEQGAFAHKMIPPLERYEAQVLTKGTWVTEFYVDKAASRAQKIAGTGQWLQFYGDGTFKGGHWGTQTHSGVWSMNFGTEKPTLILDSNVDLQDAWWEIHGITGGQDAMSWRRVPEMSTGAYRKSIMTKMMELTELPTKEQFAGQFNF
jgi:hypothetical protein